MTINFSYKTDVLDLVNSIDFSKEEKQTPIKKVKKSRNYITLIASLAIALIGLQIGCSSTPSTIHSTAPSFAPTTQALSDDSQTLGTAIVEIEGGSTAIKSKNLVGIEKPLAAIDNGVKEVKVVKEDLIVQKDKVIANQKEVTTLNDNYNLLNGKYETALKDKKDAEDKYDNSWFAGKTWRLFYWIVGVAIGLIVADCLLYFFTANAALNPLTLLVSLVVRLFRPSVPSVGSAPISTRLPRYSIIRN